MQRAVGDILTSATSIDAVHATWSLSRGSRHRTPPPPQLITFSTSYVLRPMNPLELSRRSHLSRRRRRLAAPLRLPRSRASRPPGAALHPPAASSPWDSGAPGAAARWGGRRRRRLRRAPCGGRPGGRGGRLAPRLGRQGRSVAPLGGERVATGGARKGGVGEEGRHCYRGLRKVRVGGRGWGVGGCGAAAGRGRHLARRLAAVLDEEVGLARRLGGVKEVLASPAAHLGQHRPHRRRRRAAQVGRAAGALALCTLDAAGEVSAARGGEKPAELDAQRW